MMSAQMLLAVALLGPGTEGDLAAAPLLAVAWTADELRGEFTATISQARGPGAFRPERDVPALICLHQALEQSEVLGRSEQVRLRQAVEYRLGEALEKLKHQRARTSGGRSGKLVRTTKWTAREAASRETSVTGGGAVATNVQQLIDLIEATIQPESWDVNGGRGSIRYYAPLQVLVIRNTQQVHEEIGGLRSAVGGQ